MDVCRDVIEWGAIDMASLRVNWSNSGMINGLSSGAQLSVTQGVIFRLRLRSIVLSLRASNEIKRRRWRNGFHLLLESGKLINNTNCEI